MTNAHVGTLGERPLHASLKEWYRQPGDLIEEPVDGFVIDLVRDDLLVEIQTRSFSKMKRKLIALLPDHRIRIVHPIAVDRWIVRLGEGGEVLSRRKSPKHGSVFDLFGELVAFPELMNDPRLELEVVLTHEDELRRHEPGKAWRRKGWVVEERHLIDVLDSMRFGSSREFIDLLADVPAAFTTADLSAAVGCSRRLSQQMAYCLRKMGMIVSTGKQGNAVIYEITTGDASD